MVLGTLLAFFGTGFFSGSGIIGSEIFPTSVRARALGYLQRRAHYEFDCTFCHRTRGTGKGIELGVLFVRSVVSAVMPGGHAVAGDEGEAIGVRNDRFANESVTGV